MRLTFNICDLNVSLVSPSYFSSVLMAGSDYSDVHVMLCYNKILNNGLVMSTQISLRSLNAMTSTCGRDRTFYILVVDVRGICGGGGGVE